MAHKIMKVELDGVILNGSNRPESSYTFPPVNDGAIDMLNQLRKDGWLIDIVTIRVSKAIYKEHESNLLARVRDFLVENKIPFDGISNDTPPVGPRILAEDDIWGVGIDGLATAASNGEAESAEDFIDELAAERLAEAEAEAEEEDEDETDDPADEDDDLPVE